MDKNKKQKAATKKDIVSSPRGMSDILSSDMRLWEKMLKIARDIIDFYNFMPVETTILENVDLFARTRTEEEMDTEMFIVRSRADGKLVLRPELRSPIMRSYIEHSLSRLPQPQRLSYFGPVFRQRVGQNDNRLEYHELGFEVIGGSNDPIYDTQVINTAYKFLEELRIKNLMIGINSMGCSVCRPNYRKKILAHYKDAETCRDCKRYLPSNNPVRVLECINENCIKTKSKVSSILDSLCSNCNNHFKHVLEFLEEISLPYAINPNLVGTVDYHNKTVFNITVEGMPVPLVSGGRYDYLAELLGGHATPAVGAAVRFDAIFKIVKEGKLLNVKSKEKVFLVYIGDLAKRKSLSLIEEFRKHNVPVIESLGKDSLATQLEIAARLNAPIALIFGQKEAYEETVILRDMPTGVQELIPLKKIVEEVKRRLK